MERDPGWITDGALVLTERAREHARPAPGAGGEMDGVVEERAACVLDALFSNRGHGLDWPAREQVSNSLSRFFRKYQEMPEPKAGEVEVTEETLGAGRVTYTPGHIGWFKDFGFYLSNNHVLLAAFLAHPLHPYPRGSRAIVLFNSLAFGFFITGMLRVIIPAQEGVGAIARSTLQATAGTILQLLFDIPASLIATCPCAHKSLPGLVQVCCRGAASCCLSVHTCLAVLLTLLSLLLLTFGGNTDEVWSEYSTTKANAFIGAVPSALVIYAVLRQCEAGEARANGTGMV